MNLREKIQQLIDKATISKEIETLITESGLEVEGESVTEKVEGVIEKAEDGELWYVASGKLKSLASGSDALLFSQWKYNRLPKTDFSNVTSLSYAIYSTQLEYIDFYINSSKCRNFGDALSVNKKLKWIVGIDLSSATTIFDLFMGNGELETIQEPLNIPNVTRTANAFGECLALKDIRFVPETIKMSISFAHSSLLSDESIQSIIDGLATVETMQTLTLHSTVGAKLTETQLTQIANKNWILG